MRAAAVATADPPGTWSAQLGTGGDVAQALSSAMPGAHPAPKVALLTRALGDRALQAPLMSQRHVDRLMMVLDTGLVREALFPWGADASTRTALTSHGVRVIKGKLTDVLEPLAPTFYEAAQKQLGQIESVFLSITGFPWDLALAAALRFARSYVVAGVPVTYVSAADEVRMRWLKSLQDQGKLLMCRCPLLGRHRGGVHVAHCICHACH